MLDMRLWREIESYSAFSFVVKKLKMKLEMLATLDKIGDLENCASTMW